MVPTLWALVLYVAAGVTADLHHATIVHAVCEHGELVHAAATDPHRTPHRDPHRTPHRDPHRDPREDESTARGAASRRAGVHEHCSPLLVLPEADGPAPAPDVARAPAASGVSARVDRIPRVGTARYRLAPKQSPPAA